MVWENGEEIEYNHSIRGTILDGVVRKGLSKRLICELSLE